MTRDAMFKSEDDFLQWSYEQYMRLYRQPKFRVLIFIVSSTLLIMGGAKRWSAFHKGSTLETAPVVNQGAQKLGQATLTYPHGLFESTISRVQRMAFQTAIDATNSVGQVVILEHSPIKTSYKLMWTPR
jgi:hypothetical protein